MGWTRLPYHVTWIRNWHTHLLLGLNNQLLTSVSCDLNMILISELNAIMCADYRYRQGWLSQIQIFSTSYRIFLVIWMHRGTTLHLPFNTIWFLLQENLNLDIGTNCRYIPSRQNQRPMNIKCWWNIDFNPLNFPAGWDCHSGNCL